ncbi:MAG: transglutaminase-like domain-containing protein [Rubripirellula sp.]
MIFNPHHIHRCARLLILPWLFAVGCDIPKRPPLKRGKTEDSLAATDLSTVEGDRRSLTDPAASDYEFTGRWETWDAYFVAGRRVGYSHLVAEPRSARQQSDVRYTVESRLYLSQGNSRILQDLKQTSTESSTGSLVDFESVVQFGPVVSRASGDVEDGTLRITTTRGAKKTTRRIPWEASYHGLVALEQSLRQTPLLEKGEQRELKMLLPGQYVLATARMRCNGMASVPLFDGKQAALLEINCEIEVDGKPLSYSTIWTDETGSIVRTYSPSIRMVAYRTDEMTAKQVPDDDYVPLSIKIDGEEKTSKSGAGTSTFRISSNRRRAETPMTIDRVPGQRMVELESGVFQVQGGRKKPGQDAAEIPAPLPQLADQDPNNIVDFNDPYMRRLSDAFSMEQSPPDEVAVELARVAGELVKRDQEYQGIVSASKTVERGKGDSLARSIFLAALLRARGMPSRVALGVRQSDANDSAGGSRMVFHAWTVAYVGDRWITLDVDDQGLAAPGRIAFATTDLSGEDAYAAMVPLMSLIRRVKIEQID